MKAQRKGFTLVEMIVAMAVLAIVLGEIGVVLTNTTKIYSKGSYEIFLQGEAQQAVQSIEELMVDATKEIKQAGGTIYVTNYINKEAGTTTTYAFSLVQDRADRPYKTLYVSQDGGAPIPVAEYVKTMSLDTASYNTNSMVSLKLEMEGEGGYQYNVTKDIYNRNEIGTGTIDPDDLTPGSGTKKLNVLRFHTYNLIAELPYGKTWVSAEFDDPTSATVYYELSGFTLKANSHLNQYESDVGEFDITCKADDHSEFKISIYSEKPGMDNDYYLFNAQALTSANCQSYFPVRGYSVVDATSCALEWYMGNIKLCEKTINLTGTDKKMAITKRKFPSDTNNLYESQFDGDSLTVGAQFKGNNFTFLMNRMCNPGDDECKKYAQLVYEYEMTQWVKCTITWDNGKTVSFRAFLYPVRPDGCIFDEDQKTVYWDVVKNKAGGSNDSWTKVREYVEDTSPATWDIDSGSISITSAWAENVRNFSCSGEAVVTFSKRVTINCYNGSYEKISGYTYRFKPDAYNPCSGTISW